MAAAGQLAVEVFDVANGPREVRAFEEASEPGACCRGGGMKQMEGG